MANKTVYPFGTGGQLPSSIGIINDLTTGGVDKALSAEMGKTLGQKVDDILHEETAETEVDVSDLTSYPYTMLKSTEASGGIAIWKYQAATGSNNKARVALVSVQGVDQVVLSQSLYVTRVAMLRSNNMADNAEIDLASGWNDVITTSGGTTIFDVPSDATLMAFLVVSTSGVDVTSDIELTLKTIAKGGILYVNDVVDNLNSDDAQAPLSAKQGKILSKGAVMLDGKTCVCFGDSITWYDGHEYNWGKEVGQVAKGYESYMREAGMSVSNQGVSGATMIGVLNKVRNTSVVGYDFVTITSGANDSRWKIPIGVLVDDGNVFDETTFIGALQAAIVYVLTNNPTAKILLMTPIKGWVYYPNGYPESVRSLVSGDGIVEEKYADAIKEVAAFYSLPVCDWYNEAGANLLTRSWYMNDPDPDPEASPNPNDIYSLHPTTAGYKRMADILIPVLRNM